MLLKRIGFCKTMDILYPILNYEGSAEMPYRDFMIEFNKISYYNAFYRVQEELKKKGIIEIKDKKIRLTRNGEVIASLYKALMYRLEKGE